MAYCPDGSLRVTPTAAAPDGSGGHGGGGSGSGSSGGGQATTVAGLELGPDWVAAEVDGQRLRASWCLHT